MIHKLRQNVGECRQNEEDKKKKPNCLEGENLMCGVFLIRDFFFGFCLCVMSLPYLLLTRRKRRQPATDTTESVIYLPLVMSAPSSHYPFLFVSIIVLLLEEYILDGH